MRSELILLLIVFVIKQIIWASYIPLWHFPDEQSHMGQVSFFAEKGRMPNSIEDDLTKEILYSERLLGTERDTHGNNSFTYHPEYRIPYSDTYIGLFEKKISLYSLQEGSRDMIKKESSHYPALYYTLMSYVYYLFYSYDIFYRVFITRFIQICFSVLTVYFSVRIGQVFFKSIEMGIIVGSMVGFHPMFSFISSGVNSDNLGNCVFTAFILCVFNCVHSKKSVKWWWLLLGVMIICIYTKPQFLIIFPIVGILIIYKSITYVTSIWRKYLFIFSITFLLISFALIAKTMNLPGADPLYRALFATSFHSIPGYVAHYMISHLYHEVLPWYWGVFDWLSLTYPRPVHRVINYFCIFSITGFFIHYIKRKSYSKAIFVFLSVIISISFVFGVYVYDWSEWSRTNVHLGVQGRYFFPTISLHMTLLLFGIQGYFPKKYMKQISICIVAGMMVLHGYALLFVVGNYYSLDSIHNFLVQASQYKPVFIKGKYGISMIIAFTIIQMIYLVSLINMSKYDNRKRQPI